jgi:hypothetical protein
MFLRLPVYCLTLYSYCLVKAAEEPAGSIWDDPEDALRNASRSIMFRFLKWTLGLTRGSKNRKLPGISTANSFKTDWKNFRIYYQKLRGEKIDAEVARRIRIVRIAFTMI